MTTGKIELPTIDVLFPFHKVDEYFFLALSSVLKSVGVRTRIIFIDNRKDKFPELENYENFYSEYFDYFVIAGTNNEYASGLNLGLNYLKSDFVGLMNSDDLIQCDKFLRQIETLVNQNCDLCIGKIVKFNYKGRLPSLTGAINPNRYSSELLLLGAYGADATIVFTKEVAKKVSFVENVRSSDRITALLEYKSLKVCGDKEAIYFYRIHSNQISSNHSYFEGNFDEVYPYWRQYNLWLNLPDLDLNSARVLGGSNEYTELSKVDYEKIKMWMSCYVSLFQDSTTRLMVERLLRRRLSLLKLRNHKIPLDVMSLLRLIIEFLITIAKRSKPRGHKY